MTQQPKRKRDHNLANSFTDRFASWATLTRRPLFGAVGIYRDNHVFAMVWRGALYFKVDHVSLEDYEAAGSHPLQYVSKGQKLALKSYWKVPVDVVEDDEALFDWAKRAYCAATDGI